jgi:hypothetical protein
MIKLYERKYSNFNNTLEEIGRIYNIIESDFKYFNDLIQDNDINLLKDIGNDCYEYEIDNNRKITFEIVFYHKKWRIFTVRYDNVNEDLRIDFIDPFVFEYNSNMNTNIGGFYIKENNIVGIKMPMICQDDDKDIVLKNWVYKLIMVLDIDKTIKINIEHEINHFIDYRKNKLYDKNKKFQTGNVYDLKYNEINSFVNSFLQYVKRDIKDNGFENEQRILDNKKKFVQYYYNDYNNRYNNNNHTKDENKIRFEKARKRIFDSLLDMYDELKLKYDK